MSSIKHALVLGARSIIAPYLVGRLRQEGFTVECIARATPEGRSETGGDVRWTALDLRAPGDWTAPRECAVFSLVPLWLLPRVLPNLGAARQVVAFGSTSALVKAESADPGERALAERLRQAEGDLAAGCRSRDLPWTLLRPTLIYGGGRDRNISAIAAFIRRFGFFPVAAPARGLRQPVHADDLAAAALAALGASAARDGAFDLPGGETLSYRRMVERIFAALGRSARILPLPPPVLAAAVAGGRRLGLAEATAEAVRRMNRDLVFDDAAARASLGYAPRAFAPELPGGRSSAGEAGND